MGREIVENAANNGEDVNGLRSYNQRGRHFQWPPGSSVDDAIKDTKSTLAYSASKVIPG